MISRLLIAAAALLFFIAGLPLAAESFPSPGRNSEVSLLGIPSRIEPGTSKPSSTKISLTGSKTYSFRLSDEEWDIQWLKVLPGRYELESAAGDSEAVLDIPEASIIVAPFRLVALEKGGELEFRVESSDEEDRQRAALRLASFFDFPAWHGRDYVGFGTIRPAVDQTQTRYSASLTSDPPGAEVYLDDRLVGETPLELQLTGVKHKLLYRLEGYGDQTRYVRLERDAEMLVELAPDSNTEDNVAAPETYSTIVGDFIPLGEDDVQLSALFADTLEIALEEDDRLSVSSGELAWQGNSPPVRPDYRAMDDSGADLIVSGFFVKSGSSLAVQANLYDLQAEASKAGFHWSGNVGLGIFDAMDEITESFMENVDRYLPETGRSLETTTEILYEGASEEEYDLFRSSLIRRRWMERPHSLSLTAGVGGGSGSIIVSSGVSTQDMNLQESLNVMINLDWVYDFGEMFALNTGITLSPFIPNSNDDGRTVHTDSPFQDLMLRVGPRLMFRTLKSDLYLGLSAVVAWAPEYSFSWDDGGPQFADAGSFIRLDFPLEFGFNVYLTERSDKIPLFLKFGVAIGFIGYRFDLSGRSPNGMTNFSGLISVGMGVRL